MADFLQELGRRNVFRVAIAYAVIAWLLLQVGATLAPALLLPNWVMSLLALLLILGFPLAVFLAWAYELTPDGVKPERPTQRNTAIPKVVGRKLDFLIIGMLAIAVLYFMYDKFLHELPQPTSDTVAATDSVPQLRSIAVLPFVNMSSDTEQEYFSDGLSDELLNLLARIPGLRVTSRSSAFSYKGKDFKIADVGRDLGVSHVLEGSVRKSNNQIRITAQLIEVSSDDHLWSDTWDRDFENVFVIQDEIAAAVVAALKLRLLGDVPHAEVTDPQAYALFLQTSELMARRSQSSLESAEEIMQQVLAIDSNYVPALVRLGSINLELGGFSYRPLDEATERARGYAQKALRIDNNSSAALALLAKIAHGYDFDRSAAEAFIDRVLAIDDTNSAALILSANLAAIKKQWDEHARLIREAIALDPFSAQLYFRKGIVLTFRLREYNEAATAFRKAIVLSPDGIALHFGLGQALFLMGDYERALEAFDKEKDEIFGLVGHALVYYKLGDMDRADQALAEIIRLGADVAGAQIAEVYAIRGEVDLALQWLDRAYENNDQGIFDTNTNPFVDNLRGDPRFEAFLKRLDSTDP